MNRHIGKAISFPSLWNRNFRHRSLLSEKIQLKSFKQTRFQSTTQVASTTRCPFTGISNSYGKYSKPHATINDENPELVDIPSYPFIGSFISELSGIPKDGLQPFSFWTKLTNKFGHFFTIGLPSIGSKKDNKGTMFVITDPREMMAVIRQGGKYPSGQVEGLWVIRKWNELRNMHTAALLGEGNEEWKRIRTFFQKDLLHPESARGYIPAIIRAAKLASKGAPAYKNDMNTFLAYSAFDLFSAVMFGEMTNSVSSGRAIVDGTSPQLEFKSSQKEIDAENRLFAKSVHEGLGASVVLSFDPLENLIFRPLGITTKGQQHCFDHFDKAWEIGHRKITHFAERKEANMLNNDEKNSYLFRAIDRQKEKDSGVTAIEAKELAYTGLFAAVDTTSGFLGWILFNIALTPSVQEKLFQEISTAVSSVSGDGQLSAKVFEPEHIPYLNATIREAHRMTPTQSMMVKRVGIKSLKVHDKTLTEGDVVALQTFTIGHDSDIMTDPLKFMPERWLPDAVKYRKGTPSEIIDHPFLKLPFSQGARRCPGYRVAMNEIQVMIAQLILDWKISSPDVTTLEDMTYSQKTVVELEVPALDFQRRV